MATRPDSLNFLLIGKTGTGKSATANSILRKEVFKRNPRSASFAIPSEPRKETGIFNGKHFSVVDGLNIGESTNEDEGDIDRDIAALTKAFRLCDNDIAAILIVLQFGVQFSKEETEALNLVKAILGERVISLYGICVITHGDNYHHALEEGEFKNFKDWVQEQPKGFQDIIKECDDRYVIFNNRSKDAEEKKKQVDTLFGQIFGLSKHGRRRYLDKDFQVAERNHESLRSKRKPLQVEQKVEVVLESVRKRFHEMDGVGQTDSSRLKALLKELTELSKYVAENTEGGNSAISSRCAPQIQTLYMEINSQITKLSHETRRVGKNDASSMDHRQIGDTRAFGQRLPKESLEHKEQPLERRNLRDSDSDYQRTEHLRVKQAQATSVIHGHPGAASQRDMTPVETSSRKMSEQEKEFESIKLRAEKARETLQKSQAGYKSEIESLVKAIEELTNNSAQFQSSPDLWEKVKKYQQELQSKLNELLRMNESPVTESGINMKKMRLDDERKRQTTAGPTVAASESWMVEGTASDTGNAKVTMTAQMKTARPDVKGSIDLLLIGRSGNGRSATGNAILGKPAFKASASTSGAVASGMTNILMESTEIDGVTVNVIDGPGINDSEDTQNEDLEMMVNAVEKSMTLCDYGFSALLIIVKFGVRFTKQEVDAIKMIKGVLGKNVINEYGICVVTHGDNFDREAEEAAEDGEELTFEGWCRGQESAVRELFEECSFRCVLFDNKTKDSNKRKSQVKKLMDLIDAQKRYSKEEFLEAEGGLQQFTFETMIPQLEEEAEKIAAQIREKLNDLEKLKLSDPSTYKENMQGILTQIQEFKSHIEELGQGLPAAARITIPISLLEIEIRRRTQPESMPSERKYPMSAATSGTSRTVPFGGASPAASERNTWVASTQPRAVSGMDPLGIGETNSAASGWNVRDVPTQAVTYDETNESSLEINIFLKKIDASLKSLNRETDDNVYRTEMNGLLEQVRGRMKDVGKKSQGSTNLDSIFAQLSQKECDITEFMNKRDARKDEDYVHVEHPRSTGPLRYPYPTGGPQQHAGYHKEQHYSYSQYQHNAGYQLGHAQYLTYPYGPTAAGYCTVQRSTETQWASNRGVMTTLKSMKKAITKFFKSLF